MCVCLCYPDFLYDFFLCLHSHTRIIKGTSKSSMDGMLTVMRTTDIFVVKDFKLTWHEIWEIEVVSIMKEDLIEKGKDYIKYEWLPKMTTCSKISIGSLLTSGFCEGINSCANPYLTKHSPR